MAAPAGVQAPWRRYAAAAAGRALCTGLNSNNPDTLIVGGGERKRGERGSGGGGGTLSTGYPQANLRKSTIRRTVMQLLFVFELIAATVCLGSTIGIWRLWQEIRRTALEISEARDLAKRAARVLPDLADFEERLDALAVSLKRLHSRAGMRELRERSQNGGADREPDWRKDPEGFRSFHERRLRMQKGDAVADSKNN